MDDHSEEVGPTRTPKGGRWSLPTIVAFWWLPAALAASGSPLAMLMVTV